MLSRIVVAIDGSDLSREAFDYALALAAPAQLPVLLLHAREYHSPLVSDARRADQDLAHVSELIESCRNMASIRAVDLEVRIVDGPVLDLLAEAPTAGDLLAVGLKGRFKHTGIGSTTKWLLTNAAGPVMVVAGPPLRPVNRLVAVYDGAAASTRAVEVAIELSRSTSWPPTILVVPAHGVTLDAAVERAEQISDGAQVIVHPDDGRPEAVRIEAFADQLGHAMLVVAAYPDSWFHQLFLTNTTAHLLQNLGAPVIVVP